MGEAILFLLYIVANAANIFVDVKFTFTLNKINDTAVQFWSIVGNKRVFAFHGEMGAGKTTFIHALCNAKGVKDVVGSPTFSIINEYNFSENGLTRKIFHIDLYRLKSEQEVIQAGVEDCLYSNQICLVEWPEKAPNIFPAGTTHVFIEPANDETRMLTIRDI